MKNPIREARQEAGISMGELALVAGVGYSTVGSVEKGRFRQVNKEIIQALEELGFDGEELMEDYQDYRRQQAEHILTK